MEEYTKNEINNKDSTEIQADIKVRYCRTHPKKDIIGFCKECNVFFCRRCVHLHIDHGIESVKKFCEEGRENLLKKVSMQEFCTQLEEVKNEVTNKRDKLRKERNNINKEVDIMETIIKKNKEEIYKKC